MALAIIVSLCVSSYENKVISEFIYAAVLKPSGWCVQL